MAKMKMGVMQMVEAARAEIEEVEPDAAILEAQDPDCLVIDIRDIRELERDGQVPGAIHAPRDMLAFWVDPESPYYRNDFGTGQKFVLFCAGGGRRCRGACTGGVIRGADQPKPSRRAACLP